MLRVKIKYKNDGYEKVIDHVASITLTNSLTRTDIICIISLESNGDINEYYASLSVCDITEVSFQGIVKDEMEAPK